MINIMYVTTYGPVRVYMRKCLCFFKVFVSSWKGFYEGVGGRNIGRQNSQHAYTWANVVFFYNFYVQIRSAWRKVTTPERPVGGGKREGGIMYIWIEICTPKGQGPGGLLPLTIAIDYYH